MCTVPESSAAGYLQDDNANFVTHLLLYLLWNSICGNIYVQTTIVLIMGMVLYEKLNIAGTVPGQHGERQNSVVLRRFRLQSTGQSVSFWHGIFRHLTGSLLAEQLCLWALGKPAVDTVLISPLLLYNLGGRLKGLNTQVGNCRRGS